MRGDEDRGHVFCSKTRRSAFAERVFADRQTVVTRGPSVLNHRHSLAAFRQSGLTNE
jgi:hypothetical protein